MEPPTVPLIKSKSNTKLGKYYVKIELHRDPTSEKSDLYEFKISLFDNREPEEFFLFVQKFQMYLQA